MGLIWHLGHFLAWLIVLVFLLAIFWIKQKHFMYSDKRFQIRIFIYSDIYCSQASRRYPWRVHYKNQDKLADSYATVWTSLWRRPDTPQCLTDKHWRRSDVRATPCGRSVNQYSTRSLFSEIDTVWEVFAIRPDDYATRPDDVQYLQTVRTTRQHVQTISNSSDNSRFPFERGKDFSKDRLDARSSRLDTKLIRIELRCFWRISQKSVQAWQTSVRKLDRQSPNLNSFWGLLKSINRGL
jgi:hypothetical protein